MAEELVNNSHRQMKEEEGRRIAAVETFFLAEKRIQELDTKLTKADRERKSAEAALYGAKKQEDSQHRQLHQTKDQLFTAREHIDILKKKLEEAEKAAEKAGQDGYNIEVAETEETLKDEVFGVCRTYCFQVWNETLNQVGVEAFSALSRAENVYYPLAI